MRWNYITGAVDELELTSCSFLCGGTNLVPRLMDLIDWGTVLELLLKVRDWFQFRIFEYSSTGNYVIIM